MNESYTGLTDREVRDRIAAGQVNSTAASVSKTKKQIFLLRSELQTAYISVRRSYILTITAVKDHMLRLIYSISRTMHRISPSLGAAAIREGFT